MTDFYVEADLAKTGRSTCRGCKQTIEKGALRIADSYVEDHFQNHPWHHAECLTKLSKRHADLEVEKIRGYDELPQDDRNKIRKVVEQIQQNMRDGVKPTKKAKKTVAKPVAKDDSSPSPQPAKKTKKPKAKSQAKTKSAKSQGLTAKELKEFKAYCEQYEQKATNDLKDILTANNQVKTGTKQQLVERCAQGKLLGRTPTCSECGGGKLRFNRQTVSSVSMQGGYSCPGYMDDDEFKRCGRSFTRSEITRTEWKQ